MEKLTNALDQLDNYLPKEIIVERHSQFTINQLTWLEINRERYQLAHAIKRIGRRLYFHMPSLLEWIAKQDAQEFINCANIRICYGFRDRSL